MNADINIFISESMPIYAFSNIIWRCVSLYKESERETYLVLFAKAHARGDKYENLHHQCQSQNYARGRKIQGK